jgi:hypothetical protein
LAIFLRDEAGEMMGGICGELWGAVLETDFLWIDESLRGQGVGKRLLLMLEEAARERNGRTAILNTFDFQSPDFYQSLGYEIMGIIEGFSHQHRKYFLRKSLTWLYNPLMSQTATRSKSGYALLYQVLLIFLMMWEVFTGWVVTAVYHPLSRQTPFLLDRFSLLSLWDITDVPYTAYPLSCCLLE